MHSKEVGKASEAITLSGAQSKHNCNTWYAPSTALGFASLRSLACGLGRQDAKLPTKSEWPRPMQERAEPGDGEGSRRLGDHSCIRCDRSAPG